MNLYIELNSVDEEGAVITMTIVGDPNNAASGTFRINLNESVSLPLDVATNE